MTKDEWEKGKEMIEKLEEASARKNNMKRLVDRMLEISGKYQETIKIKLGEQYVNTPIAEVSFPLFSEFMLGQIKTQEARIKYLQKEFEEI